MQSNLRAWRDLRLSKIVLRILKERRDLLNQELIEQGIDSNRFRIMELNNLIDEDLFEKLVEDEVIDEV